MRGRGEHRGEAEREGGGGGGCAEGDRGRGWGTERGAGQQGHLRGRSDLRRQLISSFESFPETHRPECKSW